MKKISFDIAWEDPTELITFGVDAGHQGFAIRIVQTNEESLRNRGQWPLIELSGDGQDMLEFLDARGFDFRPEDLVDVK
jgi:hypothetical protein